jgi:hypothetical protein
MLVAALVGALAIMPALAAVGTVVLDKTYVAPAGGAAGTVTVTLTDADLNTATSVIETLDTSTTTLSAGVSETIFLANGNVLAGTLVLNDVGAGQAESDPLILEVTLASSVQGRIVITAGSADYAGDLSTVTIDYDYATVQSQNVTVTSTVGTSDISVALTETGANTGIFTGSFIVGSHDDDGGVDNDGTDTITGKAGLQSGVITVTYEDADPDVDQTATVTVEANDAVGTVVSPADDSRTTSLTPTLKVQFTDDLAGVDEDTITFDVAVNVGTVTPSGTGIAPDTITALTGGGFEAELDLTVVGATDPDTVTVTWSASATDLAGNVTAPTIANTVVVSDREAPTMDSAQTGTWWDAALDTDGDPNGVTGAVAGTADLNTSIAVTFNEDLDPASVAAADFEVDGVAPSAATVFTGGANIVFLTVPALGATDTPEVELVAGLSDSAGNSLGSADAITSADGIAPTVTWSLSATLVQGGTDPVLSFSGDEQLNTVAVDRNGVGVASQVVDVTANSRQVTHVTSDAGADDGAYALEITVGDGTNSATVGTDLVATSDILYEVDTDVPDPIITDSDGSVIADEGDVGEAAPLFITFDYTAEGVEYGLDDAGAATNVAANVATDQDTHGDVAITAVTLDGVDVLANLDTQDDVTFDVALAGVAVGDHTIVITATDDAGNSGTFTRDFTVVARSDYSVNMNLGWNLVSLPADPVDTSLDSVLPSTHPATEVLTFQNGEWLVALRGSDGTWSSASTLTSMDSSHAYWVNSLSSTPITVLLVLEFGDAQINLPTIGVVPGWNMVPVVDHQQRAFGHDIDADDYMTTITWKLAYGFAAGAWDRITPGSSDVVETGRGYWVWVTGAGTLVP